VKLVVFGAFDANDGAVDLMIEHNPVCANISISD